MDRKRHVTLLENVLETLISDNADKHMIDHTMIALERARICSDLDYSLIEDLRLVSQDENSELYDTDSFKSIAHKIDKKSIIIYFKTADSFRIYNEKNFAQFQNRVFNTFKEHKEIYEVIDNDRPQKIIIIAKTEDLEELDKIKKYIAEYGATIGQVISDEDIMTFKNSASNSIEIIINKFYVPNATAKDVFVSKLLDYISRKEKSGDIYETLAIKFNGSVISPIDNTSLVLIPHRKDLLGASQHTDIISECYLTREPTIVNINVNANIQNVLSAKNITLNNIVNNNNVIEESNDSDETDDPFIEQLRDETPEWFVPGKVIKYDILYDEYISKYNPISKRAFTAQYENVLYKKYKRTTVGKSLCQLIKLLELPE